MKITIKYLIFALLVQLYSCTENNTGRNISTSFPESASNLIVIKPEMTEEWFTDATHLFRNIRLVPLETTPECLIGSINRMQVYEERIFIMDEMSNALLTFDLNGKFLSKIGAVGHGPGEYVQIDYFHIDFEKKQIVITDLMSYYVLRYDMNGTFIKKVKIPLWIEGISPWTNGGYLLHANFRNNKKTLKQEHNILLCDSNMKIVKAYQPYNSDNLGGAKFLPGFGPCYDFNNRYNYYSMYSDTTFRVLPTGLSPAIVIDFGKEGFDDSCFKNPEKLKEYVNATEFMSVLNLMETDSIIIFNTYDPALTGYYNKTTQSGVISLIFYLLKENKQVQIPPSVPMAVYNDNIVSKLTSNSFFQEERAQIGLPEPFTDLVGKVAIDDNPVLMFYTVEI